MKKKYLVFTAVEAIVASGFVALFLWFCWLGYTRDAWGLVVFVPALLIAPTLALIIRGIVSYIIFRNIVIPHCTFIALYLISLLIFELISSTYSDKFLCGTDLLGVVILSVMWFLSSLLPALITRLIMYLAGKRKANSQPTTGTIE
ncbi:MAG: hypothetical protein E7525_07245 [Ruminococcaceae bacterium]|nr:hypothetical protein [Oscillospiraceae bacterium]